jgi:hypothetical protein
MLWRDTSQVPADTPLHMDYYEQHQFLHPTVVYHFALHPHHLNVLSFLSMPSPLPLKKGDRNGVLFLYLSASRAQLILSPPSFWMQLALFRRLDSTFLLISFFSFSAQIFSMLCWKCLIGSLYWLHTLILLASHSVMSSIWPIPVPRQISRIKVARGQDAGPVSIGVRLRLK